MICKKVICAISMCLMMLTSLHAATIYVDSGATSGGNTGVDWANAYQNLYNALSAAKSGDEIWVKSGVYKPTTGTDRSISFMMKDNVNLFGGFAGTESTRSARNLTINHTTLSGDIGTASDISDNSYHVVQAADSLLDGFYISFGNTASVSSGLGNTGDGGGVFAQNTSPTFLNCSFTNNTAFDDGGALYIEGGTAWIENCVFRSNTSRTTTSASTGGAIFAYTSAVVKVRTSLFQSNSSYYGGAAYSNVSGSSLEFDRCAFYMNSATGRGGALYKGNASFSVTNSLFVNNSSSGQGGSVYAASGSASFVNNTFFGGTATTAGQEIYNAGSSMLILNSILYDTAISGQKIENASTTTPTYVAFSNVKGSGGGTFSSSFGINGGNNIDADPVYTSTTSIAGADGVLGTDDDGLILQASSPSSNTGLDVSTQYGNTDIKGLSRAQSTGFDMGAFEGQGGRSDVAAQFTSPGEGSGVESVGAVTVNINLSFSPNSAISVVIESEGWADEGLDYTLSANVINFAAGETTKSFTMTVIDDTLVESNELVSLRIARVIGGKISTTLSRFNYVIQDNDLPSAPTVSFLHAAKTDYEDVSSVTIPVVLSSANTTTTTVTYTVTGTATGGGSDYSSLASGTLTFPGGTTSQNITATIVDDTNIESDETIIVTLTAISGPSGATVGSTATFTYTIKDNDSAPEIFFQKKSSVVSEGSALSINIWLSHKSNQNVTVFCSTGSGSAVYGVDFTTSASSPITIFTGATSTSFTVLTNGVRDDTVAESDETVVFNLVSPTNATLKSGCTQHTLTIQDDDSETPVVQFTVPTSSHVEYAGSGFALLSLVNSKGVSMTSDKVVDVVISTSGSATSGVDYNFSTTTYSFSTFSPFLNVPFTILDDAVNESNETLTFNIVSAGNATIGSRSSHTATILDNDSTGAYTINFSGSSSAVTEANTTKRIGASISPAANKQITVDYLIAGGNATQGIDYTTNSSNRTITFTTGASFISSFSASAFSVQILEDGLVESSSENIILELANPSGGAAIGSSNSFEVIITDDESDKKPTVGFTSSTGTVREGTNAAASIFVGLTNSPLNTFNQDVVVPYVLSSGNSSGNATNFKDMIVATGNVTFSANTASFPSISVPIIDDLINESNEVFSVTLTAPSNANLSSISTHTVTILDNESVPALTFTSSSPQTVSENSGSSTITVRFADGIIRSVPVTFNYTLSGGTATAGLDYSTPSGTMTIPPGQTQALIPLGILNDHVNESNETFTVTLTAVNNATLGTITSRGVVITDNDVTQIQFSSTTGTSQESNSGSVSIFLTTAMDCNVYVNYAISSSGTAESCGGDFSLHESGRVKISAGSTFASLNLSVVDDNVRESNETIIITLSSPLNASLGSRTTHTYTIIDNDGNPNIEFEKPLIMVKEGSTSSFNMNVVLSDSVTDTVTVNYTVTSGSAAQNIDYTSPGSTDFSGVLSFSGGSTSQSISLGIIDDAISEQLEFFTVTLSNANNGNLTANRTARVHILDNDSEPVGQKDTVATFAKSFSFGGILSDTADAVAQDSQQRIYVAGTFSGNVDFDPSDKVNTRAASSQGLYVSRFNATGDYQQTRTILSSSSVQVLGAAVDSADFVYVAGTFTGSLTNGQTVILQSTPAFSQNAFLLKFSPDGTLENSLSFRGLAASSTSSIVDLVTGPDRSVFLIGEFSGDIDFDPGPGVTQRDPVSEENPEPVPVGGQEAIFFDGLGKSAVGGSDVYVLKLNAAGQMLWVRSFGGSSTDYAGGIAIDAQQNVYTVGAFEGSNVDFDPGPGQNQVSSRSTSYTDIFLHKLNANGDFVWVKTFGSSASTNENSGHGFANIAVNKENEIVTTFHIAGKTDVDPGPVDNFFTPAGVNSNSRDLILAKFRPDGSQVWAKVLNNAGHQHVNGLEMDALGYIYLGGDIHGGVDVDPGTAIDIRMNKGSNWPFLSRYDKNGAHQYTKAFGGILDHRLNDLLITKSHHVIGVGYFNGTVDFDPSGQKADRTSQGHSDAFAVLYNQMATSTEPLSLVQAPYVSVGGRVKFYVSGGTGPFTISIDSNGVARAVGMSIVGLQPGTFTATITDSLGDSVSSTGTVVDPRIHTQGYAFPEYRSSADFRMVSFPFHHGINGANFLQEKINNFLGGMSPDTYQIFRYTGNGGDGYELITAAPPKNGTGLWMATLNPINFTITAPSPYFQEIVEIPVRGGWNIFGNPYDRIVNVANIYVSSTKTGGVVSIRENNVSAQHFWRYDNERGEYVSIAQLLPGQSAWVFMFGQVEGTLFFVNTTESTKSRRKDIPLSELKLDPNEPLPPSPPGINGGVGGASGGSGGCLLR